MDTSNPCINNLEDVPGFDALESVMGYVIKYIDPQVFHTINVVHNYDEYSSIKQAADSDLFASFVFVGTISDSYRSILSGRIVRVATCYEDLSELISGLLSNLVTSFSSSMLKEYAAAPSSHEDTSLINTQSINKYAEKFLQSGKDIFKVIQTATGPISMPAAFGRRGSQLGKEEEAKKLAADGIQCALLDIGCGDVIMKRIQALKVADEVFGRFAVFYNHKHQKRLKIGIPNDPLIATRTVALSLLYKCSPCLDWCQLLKFHYPLHLACRLAVSGTSEPPPSSRHFSALSGLIGHRPLEWKKASSELKFPDALAVVPHEYVSLQLDMCERILDVRPQCPTVRVWRFEQVGPTLFLDLETHLHQSQACVFLIATEFKTAEWRPVFNVDPAAPKVHVKMHPSILHIRSDSAVSSVEYASRSQVSTLTTPDPEDREWVFHVQHVDSVSVDLDGKKLHWSSGVIY